MNKRIHNEAKGDMILDYVSRIIDLVNGENPDSPQSVVITAASYDEGIQLEVFQFGAPNAVEDLALFLKDTTFTDETEEYESDG